jgi:hypothetical protein
MVKTHPARRIRGVRPWSRVLRAKLSLVLIISTIAGAMSASAQPRVQGELGRLALERSGELVLQENEHLLREVSSLDRHGDGEYILVASAGDALVVLYDRHGRQIATLGARGEGPFEHTRPRQARFRGDEIVIWDAGRLRFNVFDISGEPVKEFGGTPGGIKAFAPVAEELAIYLSRGRAGLIGTLHPERGASPAHYGAPSAAHDILSVHERSGGLDARQNWIYYADAATSAIHVVHRPSGNERTIPVPDPRFNVEQPEFRFAGTNVDQAARFIFNNSRVRSLHATRDYLILESIHGRDGDRNVSISVVDARTPELLDRFIFTQDEAEELIGEGVLSADEDGLHVVVLKSPDGGFTLERRLVTYRVRPSGR